VSDTFDIAVIGGGFTGLTAAHHAALSGARVVHVIGSGLPGGLAANVGALDGFPAVTEPVSALDIALKLGEQNGALDVEVVPDDAERLEIVGDGKRVHAGGAMYDARALVVATGARLKMLDVPGAERLFDKGVSQCAWCNGSLHAGRDVVVVGGGDAALQEALHLAQYASSVTILTRGTRPRARRSYIECALRCDKIAIATASEIAEVLGADGVTGVRVRDGTTGATREMACTGVFVYIGLEPASQFLGDVVQRDSRGFVVTDADFETHTRGVFAAGAVRRGYSGRLTSAVGEATAAALGACRRSSL
jgi:thioredoxin reductase (NADPH)